MEQNMLPYMILVDFTKAFDTASRKVLKNFLQKLRCPDHFVMLVSALHAGMKASVCLKEEPSELFEVGNGAKQSCILAPTLFLIFLSMVLPDSFTDSIQ